MKIPAELDELMWTLAEVDDPAAIDEFGERHPELRGELVKRLQMVRGLRGARPRHPLASPDVAFRPSANAPRYAPTPRWLAPAAAVFVLGSVVFATVAVTTYINRQNQTARTQPSEPANPTDTNSAVTSSSTGNPDSNSTTAGPEQQPPQNPPIEQPKAPGPFDRPITVVASRISLSQALDLIARQAGVTLTSAPGMPDFEIAADYRNVSTIVILQDLGRNFGFTPMIQSEREALLIPATDPGAPESPRPITGTSSPIDPGTR